MSMMLLVLPQKSLPLRLTQLLPCAGSLSGVPRALAGSRTEPELGSTTMYSLESMSATREQSISRNLTDCSSSSVKAANRP